MIKKDLYTTVLTKRSLAPALRAATANGTAVDRAEDTSMFQAALVIVDCGVVTDGTHTIEVQESADNSSWAAVATADLQGTEPAMTSSVDDQIFEIGYLGTKRYLRVITTVTGSPSTGGIYGATIVLGDPRVKPVVRN